MTASATGHGWETKEAGTGAIVVLNGDWTARDGPLDLAAAARVVEVAGTRPIGFDASRLGRWDSSLLVFLSLLRQQAAERGATFDQAGLPTSARELLDLLPGKAPSTTAPIPRVMLLERVGRASVAGWTESAAFVTLVGETILRLGAAARGRARMRGVDLLACMYDTGLAALPIVMVVNVLVGAILAFVGAVQLRRFGADVYVANLVGVSVVREMAAVMTAIVLAGRTGGAYAAEIATMQSSEEIDALSAIGIPVGDYLVLPRVCALTAMTPLLYLYGSAFGVLGGFVVGIGMLDLSARSFATQLVAAVGGSQIVFGFVKSIAFGALIAIVGCRIGMKAGRSAIAVGRAATTAVVVGIVGVIALDAVFAVCANAVGF
jgi:phospholipid/cholesterol/gamma-HCH transport system permease protein